MIDKMVWDAKYSERSYDDNGYLHVAMTPISKATVNPYKGSELQGLTETRLEPNRIYYGYRAPEELAKGAKTFNGLFLLDEHHEIDAMSIPKQYIIGTVGTDATFKDGYLYNSLVIADQDAINCVEDKSKWEISSAYKFVPVFKEGEVETEGGDKIHYDFVMTDIRGNHVALVPEGRAGHDVRVADSKGELKKMEKETVRCASVLECQLRENSYKFKLAEVESIIAAKNLDLKVLNTIKAGSDVVAVVVGNEGHTYSIAYDDKGEIKVSELLSDASALTVSNAYMKGQMDACEFQAKEHEMKQMAHEMAHHIAEKEKCGANTVVVMEKPMVAEPVAAPIDLMAAPILPPCDTLSEVVADDGVEVNMELNKDELAKVEELEQKDDGYAEKSFYDIRDRFSDARFNNYDDFVKEIGKYGVVPGKVSVVESGITYSVKCDKGGNIFTVEFKQQPNCIEIAKVYDEEQISTKELQIKENQEAESEEDTEENAVVEVVEKEVNPPVTEKVPSLKIATDKRTTRRGVKVIKDNDKNALLKKKAKEVGEKAVKDGFPPKNMPKKKGSGKDKPVKDSDDKLKSALLEKKVKTGKIAKAAGIGSKQLKAENNKNQKVAQKPVPKVVTQKTAKPKTKEPDYDNMSAVEIMKATKGKGVPDKVAKDGGPGSGRKPGSRNKNNTVSGLSPYIKNTSKQIYRKYKTDEALTHNLAKKVRSVKTGKRELSQNEAKRNWKKHQDNVNRMGNNALKAMKSGKPERIQRFTPISSVDSKKEVKGCVGDANMEEVMQINNVFGLLMDVLSDNPQVQDGGPGSGRKKGSKNKNSVSRENVNIGKARESFKNNINQNSGTRMAHNEGSTRVAKALSTNKALQGAAERNFEQVLSGGRKTNHERYTPINSVKESSSRYEDDDSDFDSWNEKYGSNYKDPDEAFAAYEAGAQNGEPASAGMEDYGSTNRHKR